MMLSKRRGLVVDYLWSASTDGMVLDPYYFAILSITHGVWGGWAYTSIN